MCSRSEVLVKKNDISTHIRNCQTSITAQLYLIDYYTDNIRKLWHEIQLLEYKINSIQDHFFMMDWGWSSADSVEKFDVLRRTYEVVYLEQRKLKTWHAENRAMLFFAQNDLISLQNVESTLYFEWHDLHILKTRTRNRRRKTTGSNAAL
jgi:hypothetical protein